MSGEKRREKLLDILKTADTPVSGTKLAKQLNVSRQVVVQDIALLRAIDKNILATNKGYIIYEFLGTGYKETVAVKHNDEQIQDELYSIVDLGGRVLDVVVEHEIYGQIAVDLVIKTRKDVDDFVRSCNENHTKPLKELTDGVHYHTIETDNEGEMKSILEILKIKEYLLFDEK